MEVYDLYSEAAKHHEISVEELRFRLTQGEPLIQKYYEEHYGWNKDEDSTIFF